MRIVIAHEARFATVQDRLYSPGNVYEQIEKTYSRVFGDVTILARVETKDSVPEGWKAANRAKVEIHAVPNYLGPWQYLRRRSSVVRAVQTTVQRADAFLLRGPGVLATLLHRELRRWKRPYGVEVVGDPWLSFAPGSVRSVVRPIVRRTASRQLKRQCRGATAALYATRYALQNCYPPAVAAYTTHASEVQIPDDRVVSAAGLSRRLARVGSFAERLRGVGAPVRLGFIGTFSQLYKAPDDHIRAVRFCRDRGLNVELAMVGDGRYLPEMRRLATSLGLSEFVRFYGRLEGGDAIFDFLDTVELFLNASRQDGLPRALVEALARGCPAIGTEIAGIPELLSKRFLVPPDDPQRLAVVISKLLESPSLVEDAIRESVTTAADYRESVLLQRRIAFLAELKRRSEDPDWAQLSSGGIDGRLYQ